MYRNVRVIPKQLLEQLYVEKQWSVRDVADYFQCSVDTIMRRMKAYDIELRPLKKEINMVHVQALYETGKWSLHSLAKRYDVSTTTMASRMREYGLKVGIVQMLLLECMAYLVGRCTMCCDIWVFL